MVLIFLLTSQSFAAHLDSTLALVGMSRADLTFRSDYVKNDEYRFRVIDELLEDPLASINFTQTLSGHFLGDPRREMLMNVALLYGFELASQDDDFLSSLRRGHEVLSRSIPDRAYEILPVLEELLIFSPEPTASIDEEKTNARRYDSLTNYVSQNAQCIDYRNIFVAALIVLTAVDEFNLVELNLPLSRTQVDGVEGDVLYHAVFEFGELVIGDSVSNVYRRDFAVIIDPGGDDIYKESNDKGYVHVIIDESGNDTYLGGDLDIACGLFGLSVLFDKDGDDQYRAGSLAIGAGVFGVGILIDQSGDDTYHGDTFTQGAGCFGSGILKDLSGNDIYEAALYAQGFASTYGMGVLCDDSGNDRYVIRQVYLDEIRYLDHYLAMSQGFTIGFRPDLPAGIGLLVEGGGNDYFVGDIFGQGAAYWYGLGAIFERGGNDNYVGYQYVQGSGTHIALGLLIDEQGDDNYLAKGVAQGCGHDLSFGLLYDLMGDDTYVSYDLSQGAGNANGIGMLVDETGDDIYAVKKLHNTQGYGDFRREYGSIGVLLDIAGDDSYTSGEDSEFWEKGAYGIGIDWD